MEYYIVEHPERGCFAGAKYGGGVKRLFCYPNLKRNDERVERFENLKDAQKIKVQIRGSYVLKIKQNKDTLTVERVG